jgi:hypothetical protein
MLFLPVPAQDDEAPRNRAGLPTRLPLLERKYESVRTSAVVAIPAACFTGIPGICLAGVPARHLDC